ncbi:MAG TPA: glycosyltransferase family 2 protein [Mucilaginibacter sp.]
MQDLKISLITVAYNAQDTIENCIASVLRQRCSNLQYIVIDGGSTDNTIQIINKYKEKIDVLITEPDHGIYDAMNKGIAQATGDIIGTLNADDCFADDSILNDVMEVFSEKDNNILYGNLDYIDRNGKTIRKWRSAKYKSGMFNWGWMPAHPTFYCRRKLFDELGAYKLDYGSAADYELMLRFIHDKNNKFHIYYLDKVMVKMMTGGISNKNFGNRVKAIGNDLKAMRNNGILLPVITIIFKPLRKILQFF